MQRNVISILFFCLSLSLLWSGTHHLWGQDWDWTKIDTPTSPVPPRMYVQTVYDSLSQKVFLFGGSPANDVGLNDSWEYDGITWKQLSPPNNPSPRYAYNMVYDSHRHVIVLFGGEDWPTLYNDTWEYDGVTWRKISTIHSPISRAHFALAYDSKRQKVVLYGGWHWYVDQEDTWEYDGIDWTRRYPADCPGPRQQVAMAYDENRGVVVLFGGTRQYSHQGGPFGDTWEWDGSNWIEVVPALSPSPRFYHQMAFDSDVGIVILHGGKDSTGGVNDTWGFDGADWKLISTLSAPEVRSANALSYFPPVKSTVLFGGYINGVGRSNDTWELTPLTQTIDADVDIRPDTFNLKSNGRWVTTYIELPEGFDVGEIDTSTLAIVEIDGSQLDIPIYAESDPTSIGDYDLDDVADLMVKFGRGAVAAVLYAGESVEISVSGELSDGTKIGGRDILRVKK